MKSKLKNDFMDLKLNKWGSDLKLEVKSLKDLLEKTKYQHLILAVENILESALIFKFYDETNEIGEKYLKDFDILNKNILTPILDSLQQELYKDDPELEIVRNRIDKLMASIDDIDLDLD